MLFYLYLAVKLVAYVAWCFVGARFAFRTSPPGARTIFLSSVLGALRLVLGLTLGFLIWFVSTMAYASMGDVPGRGPLVYLIVYVPIRWLEWAVVAFFLTTGARRFGGFLLGSSPADRWWRLGGIALSCAADIPMILSVGGLPVGRFMC